MSIERSLRIGHRWIAIIILIPLLITTVTGILLLLRNQINWVQPVTLKQPQVKQWATMQQVFTMVTHNAETHINDWSDVSSIIYKPSKGTIQLRTKNEKLIQLNGTTANILSIEPRRTGWLIQLHEGTHWGKNMRQYVFLPAAFGLFFLLVSGGVLIFKYYNRKLKKRLS